MIVGLTGGIGSGKTTVAKMFKSKGIPVFIADVEAKKLMNGSKTLKKEIISIFGKNAYKGEILNKNLIASNVFKDKELLSKLNALVHPAVREHFKKWYKKQNAPYVIQEAAILFESGGYKTCDRVVLVTAPFQIRIKRVMERDQVSMEQVLNRIQNQWPDEDKVPLSDYIITNLNIETTEKQVDNVHKKLLQENKSSSKF